jgi:hypothetical protein
MRLLSGGVAHLAKAVEEDLRGRDTGLHEPHVTALSDLTAAALSCRSGNTWEWLNVLPRTQVKRNAKERYIERFLANSLIKPGRVMRPFVGELAERLRAKGQTVVLILDQSKIRDGFECLTVGVRFANRALPVAWKVVETRGAIGFDIQKPLLDAVRGMIPEGTDVLLAADRFYGTSSLTGWCVQAGWRYRIRLKGNTIFAHGGGEITGADAAALKLGGLEDARFHNTDVVTNIGILHEDGHPEPWIIAMDCAPSKYRTLDYGMRWGIECMFADFKSRGFRITKTQLRHCDRIERLILVLTLGLYHAVSCGLKDEPETVKKNSAPSLPDSPQAFAFF